MIPNLDPSVPAENEVLVRVEGVSKKFCRSLKRSLWYGVCDIAGELSPFGRRPRSFERRVSSDEGLAAARHRASGIESSTLDSGPSTHDHDGLRPGEFWAVNDVSFELRRGECLGLIGHNGAGKTTLLKMLNGLIKPDRGRIEMNGRVGALIALGAGFNPILTGRENIYINGSVLGLSKKEIDEKIDEIIDFAEIGDFIDSPVQNYSSGMAVRLGFSVASSLSPDVLILDEVLAVGDIGFVIKCLNRMRLVSSNAAVIFVSHSMQFVSSFCSRVIFMDHGRVEVDAREPKDAIDRYFELVSQATNTAGLGTATVDNVVVRGANYQGDASGDLLAQGTSAIVDVDFTIHEDRESALVAVSVDDISNVQIITCPLVDSTGKPLEFRKGAYRVRVDLGKVELNSGKYSILVWAAGAATGQLLVRSQGNAPFRVVAKDNTWSKFVRPVVPVVDRQQMCLE
jgi:lipopolysaccharide transport system ATP-binding protein